MVNFDYYNSVARKNFLAHRSFKEEFFWFLTIFAWVLAVISIIFMIQANVTLRGLGQIFLGMALAIQSFVLAKRFSQKTIGISQNIVDQFSPELISLFELAILEARKEEVRILTPEYLFIKMSLLEGEKMASWRLGLPMIEPSKGKPSANLPRFSEDLIKIFENLKEKKSIEVEDFLEQAAAAPNKIVEMLKVFKLTEKDFDIVLEWLKNAKDRQRPPYFWEDETVEAGIGQDWSFGYTPVLSLYSDDLSRFFSNRRLNINIFGHANKIDEIQTVLAKNNKNNCLLVGEPGVGKRTIVNALALKIARGDSLPALKYKRIRQLDIGKLTAGAGPAEIRMRLEGSLSDAVSAGNIVLYIDNFQALLGGGSTENNIGGVDASQILIPYLENSVLRIIASVTPNDYFETVRSHAGIAEAFEKIDVNPPDPEEVPAILLESVRYIEFRHNVFFPYITLKKIVELSNRYIHDVPFPEKALRLLEESAVNFSAGKLKIIFPGDIEELVSKRTNIPVGQVAEEEKKRLLNLEEFLHKRVIGQDEAIKAVADALRRARSGLSSEKRPIGVFLFLGPTGVGKTETAKALAESYYGNEKNMIRLDMSEYQQPSSIERLIGTINRPNGILTDSVLANPFSLILLDEIEKADKNVLNVFLQVFEDGRLTDARGRVSDFTNTIIIGTSNAGSEFIRENVGKLSHEELKKVLIDNLQKDGTFTPEFLNRFDGVIVYQPLTQTELIKVSNLMIDQINKRLETNRIKISIDQDALSELIKRGYSPEFGARPLRRVIEEKIENLLARKMLSGEIKEDQTFQVHLADIS